MWIMIGIAFVAFLAFVFWPRQERRTTITQAQAQAGDVSGYSWGTEDLVHDLINQREQARMDAEAADEAARTGWYAACPMCVPSRHGLLSGGEWAREFPSEQPANAPREVDVIPCPEWPVKVRE